VQSPQSLLLLSNIYTIVCVVWCDCQCHTCVAIRYYSGKFATENSLLLWEVASLLQYRWEVATFYYSSKLRFFMNTVLILCP